MPGADDRAEAVEPTDIWTADGRRVHVQRRGGLPFGVPVEALGVAAFAPLAVGALAAGVAVMAGAAAVGFASAAARSLLGGGPPAVVVGLRFHDSGVDVLVVRLDRDGVPESDPGH
ncbi:MAG: hypothetical protein M3P95_11325 [Actinomycetota bacterium]|nr:hypothetical protein [Actinomycetota bacterium]